MEYDPDAVDFGLDWNEKLGSFHPPYTEKQLVFTPSTPLTAEQEQQRAEAEKLIEEVETWELHMMKAKVEIESYIYVFFCLFTQILFGGGFGNVSGGPFCYYYLNYYL